MQGEYIRENKDLSWETPNHSRPCSELWDKEKKLPPCTWSIGAFSPSATPHVNIHPFFDQAKPRYETYPEFSSGTWPMDRMYDRHSGKLVQPFQQREKNVKAYFDQFEVGKSLIFYYLNYDNPLTSEAKRYVLVGVSRLDKFGPYRTFDGLSKWQAENAGDRVWSRIVENRYSEGEGVRLPYQEYLRAGKNGNALSPIVVEITGEMERRFKYVTRELSDDDACELIQKLIDAVSRIDEKIAPGNWKAKQEWLDKVLSETWKERGRYPGVGSVLEVLGKSDGTAFAKQYVQSHDTESVFSHVFDSLTSKKPPDWARESKKVWDQYSPVKQKLLQRLCSFDLTADQVGKTVSEERSESGIRATPEQLLSNPYLLSEEYQGEDDDDVIGFYRIDNGLLPHASLNVSQEVEPNDKRRLRALMIEELKREESKSGSCFLQLEELLTQVEESEVEWRKKTPSPEMIMAESEFYQEKLTFFEHDKRHFVYLKSLRDDEKLIQERIIKLMEREYTPSGVDWEKRLTLPHPSIPERVYSKVLSQQAGAVETSFKRRLSIITGAAGTGKTTVIKTLIDEIKSREKGATFLLLAPTGKARENLSMRTGLHDETMTIHRALNTHGWLAPKTYRYIENKKNRIIANNIVIDESSMLDLELLAHLFRAIQWEDVQRLVLVGDTNQLPPIGYGRPFFDIVSFLEKNKPETVNHLEINCRQMIQQSNVLKLASMYTEIPDKDFDSLINRIEKAQPLGDDLEVVFWKDQINSIPAF